MKRLILPSFVLLCCFSLSGCLKSRLQLREDGEDKEASKPVAAQVQDVQPQGSYVIDEIKSELTKMNGRLEDLERAKNESASAAGKDEFKKLETRIVELEQAQGQMIEAIKKIKESPAVENATSSDLLEKGKAQFQEDDCDSAVETFTSVLKSAKGAKAEEATFYRAECYFKLKQFKKAIVDYSRFPEKFTKSKHMPVALLKIGSSFELLGMKDDAKGFYQELIEKFPKSPEAKKAKAKLK
jgi:TolA-binding protein